MVTVDGDPSTRGTSLCTSRPPRGYQLVRAWTLECARDLLEFRVALKRELSDGPEPAVGSVAGGVVLVASELATNGLRHGVAPTLVRLLRRGDDYLLDVADHGLSSTPRIAGARAAGQGGFGLHIVRRIAVDVGWYRSGAMKHVWALFPARCLVPRS